MVQRAAVQRRELAILVAIAGPDLRHRADASDDGNAVARRATRSVERRPEAVLGGLDFREILQSEPKQLQFHGCDARQRASRQENKFWAKLASARAAAAHGSRIRAFILPVSFHDDRPAHQIVPGAARPRAFETRIRLFRAPESARFASPRFCGGIVDIHPADRMWNP